LNIFTPNISTPNNSNNNDNDKNTLSPSSEDASTDTATNHRRMIITLDGKEVPASDYPNGLDLTYESIDYQDGIGQWFQTAGSR
jgi:hypothetical protein